MGKKKVEEKPIKKTSKIYDGNDLLEQGYNLDENKTYYIRWDFEKEKHELQTHLEYDHIKYIPIKDDLLLKGAVLLPSEPKNYGDIEDLELEINAFIEAWLDISEEHRQKATWYIMLSWIIDNLHTIPYLRALGDYGTGKTRYLDVIGGLCYKPMFVGGSVRAAPIYRVIDLWRGTAIFDEFTLGKSDETEDIIQILNCGYQRGKPVLRCDGTNYDKVRAFDPFGAKILATRKEFYDKALESRCITEIMKTTPRKEVPRDFTKEFFKYRNELQNKLLMYRFKNLKEIDPDESVKIDFGNLLPRIQQSLTPFTVLFQYNEERLNNFIEYAKKYNNKIIEENATSFDGQIFNAFVDLLDEHNQEQQALDDHHSPHITAKNIRECLINDGFKDTLKSSTIGRHLKTLGFDSNVMKIGGKTMRILNVKDDLFAMLKMKYVVTAVTEVTDITEAIGGEK